MEILSLIKHKQCYNWDIIGHVTAQQSDFKSRAAYRFGRCPPRVLTPLGLLAICAGAKCT
jgi:hypothetical protein